MPTEPLCIEIMPDGKPCGRLEGAICHRRLALDPRYQGKAKAHCFRPAPEGEKEENEMKGKHGTSPRKHYKPEPERAGSELRFCKRCGGNEVYHRKDGCIAHGPSGVDVKGKPTCDCTIDKFIAGEFVRDWKPAEPPAPSQAPPTLEERIREFLFRGKAGFVENVADFCRSELEIACRTVCERCAKGLPMERGRHKGIDSAPYCRAAAIRERMK